MFWSFIVVSVVYRRWEIGSMRRQRSAPEKFSLRRPRGGVPNLSSSALDASLSPRRRRCHLSYRRRAEEVFSTYQQSKGVLVDGVQRHRPLDNLKANNPTTQIGPAPQPSGP